MNYIKFLESKLGQFLGKLKLIRICIMKLYIRQLRNRGIAYPKMCKEGILSNGVKHNNQ